MQLARGRSTIRKLLKLTTGDEAGITWIPALITGFFLSFHIT